MDYNSQAQNYAAFLRRKMILSRLTGILSCIIAIAGIVLMYLGLVSEWMCIIVIGYAMAMIFTSNSFLQGIKIGNPWQRINMVCAIFFYIAVLALIIYGFIAGELVVQF